MKNGRVDEDAFRKIVNWQIKEGSHGLVPVGTTGESPTVTPEEHKRVIEICVEVAAGRVPVIAGTGSNNTEEAIEYTRHARKAKADAALIVVPYYNKPTQDGIYAHFSTIARAVDIPIVVYNVPGRTASNIEAATTLRLAEVENIVGVKEASGNLAQIDEIIRNRPADFAVLSGDDALTLAVMAHGGDGVISVTSNATPRLMAELVDFGRAGDFVAARETHRRLAAWMSAAFVEPNPLPVKAALAAMGRMANVLRAPLVPLASSHEAAVRAALAAAGALDP